MLPPHRPSILQRPRVEGGGKVNCETEESVFQKAQATVAAKAKTLQAHEERMLAAFYGTAEDKHRAWSAA